MTGLLNRTVQTTPSAVWTESNCLQKVLFRPTVQQPKTRKAV